MKEFYKCNECPQFCPCRLFTESEAPPTECPFGLSHSNWHKEY